MVRILVLVIARDVPMERIEALLLVFPLNVPLGHSEFLFIEVVAIFSRIIT
jgi:hypothetical protein